jgi:multidrug efflux pump subunit AcrB
MQDFPKQTDNLITIFAKHKVAANLLMLMLLFSGVFALIKMNTQFFPNFALDIVTVNIVWRGASAEDVETSITRPVEEELRSLDYVKKMDSISANGASAIVLEYEEGTDMGEALDQVKERVSLLRNLPKTTEKPEISHVLHYDLIGRLLITGTNDVNELRHFAQHIEHELLDRGISKINTIGLPEEEVAIQVPMTVLEDLGVTLQYIGDRIAHFSRDLPAGFIGRNDVTRQLRSLEQRRSELTFGNLPIISDKSGRLITVSDIATIERRPRDNQITLTYLGKPAVELSLNRAEKDDALKSAKIVQEWLAEAKERLPSTINLTLFLEMWQLIDDRISLLLRNGGQGLFLVVFILFLFLNGYVAFWVAMGIPISLMAMLAILYGFGGSINMISLFAMIMALGIIVDDAIVVGEDAYARLQRGEDPLAAAENGAINMLGPVMASSLTTIAAFIPLMFVSGVIGNILFDIPFVMICVMIASSIECFFVLPGHLRHSFHAMRHQKPSKLRLRLESAFNSARDDYFRPLVVLAVNHRWTMLSSVLTIFLLIISLLIGGRVQFNFFPTPESTMISANASFVAGTPAPRVAEFVSHLEKTLFETNKEFGDTVIKVAVSHYKSTASLDNMNIQSGGGGANAGSDHLGSIMVELVSPDKRTVRNKVFIRAWRDKIIIPAGLEKFTIAESKSGPPGSDLQIRLTGETPEQLKAAAMELSKVLETFSGVSAVQDDMPFGQEQWVYSLTPLGKALGLTIESVGQQLRAAFDGYLAQIFQDGRDEIEVRVLLPDNERNNLARLEDFNIRLADGTGLPFSSVVHVETRRGFETLRRSQARLAIQILGDVDKSLNNANNILANLEENILPDLTQRYSVKYSFEGLAADQAETVGDMLRGVVFAFIMIYLILAWQFSSYGWPFIVLVAIPFGLIGAIFGHWILHIDLTILSLFGFFGLSGIVVNDSIVLVTFYKELRAEGVPISIAIVEAACQRLRAVLLTSLTTIGGLMPLLFEKSLQAQFLIPMAVSISFGLMFSTILVLLVVPGLLSIYERFMMPEEEWTGEVASSLEYNVE